MFLCFFAANTTPLCVVGAAVDIAIVLAGEILDVVSVQSELRPIDLGFVKLLPRLKVKLCPVVAKLFVT